jgi:hypothetical protein
VTLRPGAQSRRIDPALPKPGDVLLVDDQASVQFAGLRHLIIRVGKVRECTTYQGWVWLRGYVLDRQGTAVEQREIFAKVAGLKPAKLAPSPERRPRS